MIEDVNTFRYMENPPAEVFEATARDAAQLLVEDGGRAGFLLVMARHGEDGNLKTTFAHSSGSDSVRVDVLTLLLAEWLQEEAG